MSAAIQSTRACGHHMRDLGDAIVGDPQDCVVEVDLRTDGVEHCVCSPHNDDPDPARHSFGCATRGQNVVDVTGVPWIDAPPGMEPVAVDELPPVRRLSTLMTVLDEIAAERGRQDAKWGQQNHPDVDPVLTGRKGGCTAARMAEECGVPTALRARKACQGAADLGQCTWALILVEEIAESIETATLAAQGKAHVAELRAELIQAAAVLVAWVEAIDRRTGGEP